MSLKAKVEAVIYAAEEPVTLAQLAGIFANEVPIEEPEESLPSSEDGQEQPEAVEPMLWADSSQAEDQPQPIAAAEADAPATDNAQPADEAPSAPVQNAAMDEKKAARLRERQVREGLQKVLDELIADYENGERGMEIREIAGGYRIATKPEYHDAVRGFVKSLKPPMKLSLQALETLAVVAYKQPVTAPEVGEIRGVDSGGVLGSLISRKLITTAGRKHVIGRPILYKTTKEFLLRFGLKDLNELPSVEEFEKMAGELAEAEAEAEDAAMRSSDLALDGGEVEAVVDEMDEVPSEEVAEAASANTQQELVSPADGEKLPE